MGRKKDPEAERRINEWSVEKLREYGFTLPEIYSFPGYTPAEINSDCADLISKGLASPETVKNKFCDLYSKDHKLKADVSKESFFSCFKPLTDFEEKDPEWLVPYRIPKGQISLLCSDGGAGKTTLSCELIAAISNGKGCFLDDAQVGRKPMLTALLSTEDSVSQKLKRKLREAGANMDNVLCSDFSADKDGNLRNFKFGTKQMAAFVEHYRPSLVTFDPLQGFVPPDVNMGSRNAMRDCLAPFIGLGEQFGTTFLILCHSNKRKGAYGRDRIADSADLWDIARSVLMVGYTDQPGQRYLSHEKSSLVYRVSAEFLKDAQNAEDQKSDELKDFEASRQCMEEAYLKAQKEHAETIRHETDLKRRKIILEERNLKISM